MRTILGWEVGIVALFKFLFKDKAEKEADKTSKASQTSATAKPAAATATATARQTSTARPQPAPRPAAPATKPGAASAKPGGTSPSDLDALMSVLQQIEEVIDDSSEAETKTASRGRFTSVSLLISDMMKFAPSLLDKSVTAGKDERADVVVDDLYNKLARGKVTTTAQNFLLDVPQQYVPSGAHDKPDELVSIPLHLIVAALDPVELKKRTSSVQKDFGVDSIPNLFVSERKKAAAATAQEPAKAAAPQKQAAPAPEPKAVAAEKPVAAAPAAPPPAPKAEPVVETPKPKAPEPRVEIPAKEPEPAPHPPVQAAPEKPPQQPTVQPQISPPKAPAAAPLRLKKDIIEEPAPAPAPVAASQKPPQEAPKPQAAPPPKPEPVAAAPKAPPAPPPKPQPIAAAPKAPPPLTAPGKLTDILFGIGKEAGPVAAEPPKPAAATPTPHVAPAAVPPPLVPKAEEKPPAPTPTPTRVPMPSAVTPPPKPAPVASAPTPPAPAVPTFAETGRVPPLMHRGIDLNSASTEDLLSHMEGIGDAMAERIVQDRTENGPFYALYDLARVPGVGAKLFEKMTGWKWHEDTYGQLNVVNLVLDKWDGGLPDLNAVAARFQALTGFEGCVILHRDGHLLATSWNPKSSQALEAMGPQIIKRTAQYMKSVCTGETMSVTVFMENRVVAFAEHMDVIFVGIRSPRAFNRRHLQIVHGMAMALGKRFSGLRDA